MPNYKLLYQQASMMLGEYQDEVVPGLRKKIAELEDSIVHCEECRHRIYKYLGGEIGEVGGCEIFNAAIPCDFFCAAGERRNEKKDEWVMEEINHV